MPVKPKKYLSQRFISCSSDSLVIETIQTIDRDLPSIKTSVPVCRLRILKLKGTWRANQFNELVFDAILRNGATKTYAFRGSWELNKNQQIQYVSDDKKDTLIFKGYWSLFSASRLVYVLEGNSASRFEFKAQLESSSLYPKKGQLRYRIGIGIRKSRMTLGKKLLVLYGEWKFGRGLGLLFSIDYGRGKIKAVNFGAEVLFGRTKVVFQLKDERSRPLGLTLSMSYKFLKIHEAEVLTRLKARAKERSIEAGISIPF